MSDNSQSTAVSPRPSLDQASLSQTEKDLPLGMETIEIKEGPFHVPEHGEGTGEQFSEMLKVMNHATGHDAEGMHEKIITVDRGRGDEKVVLVDWEENDPEVRILCPQGGIVADVRTRAIRLRRRRRSRSARSSSSWV